MEVDGVVDEIDGDHLLSVAEVMDTVGQQF